MEIKELGRVALYVRDHGPLRGVLSGQPQAIAAPIWPPGI